MARESGFGAKRFAKLLSNMIRMDGYDINLRYHPSPKLLTQLQVNIILLILFLFLFPLLKIKGPVNIYFKVYTNYLF